MEQNDFILKKYLLCYGLLPIILNFIIESFNRKSLWSACIYVLDKPFLFLFNVLIIMLTLSVAMYFSREMFVICIISIVWILFGFVNFIILHFRVTPFSAVDFTLIKSAISVSGHYLSVLNVFMIIFAIIILVVSVIYLFKKTTKLQKNRNGRTYLMSTVFMIVLIASIALIRYKSISVQALSTDYTNISEAYENYGFVYCFTNSILDTGISKPENYSEESVSQVVKSLKKKESSPEVKPDIIMIQWESFFDICSVKNLSFSKDPTPNFHKLQKEASHGLLTVPTVGAGTVNTEFEVLTGMSQRDFGVCEYPYKTVLKKETAESICFNLKKIGYKNYMVHNNTATFYGRNKVFSNLGFDNFTSIEFMNGVTLNPNGWAKDDIITDQIMDVLNQNEDPVFCGGITVQSHGKYDNIQMEEKSEVQVYGAPEGSEDSYQYYVSQIHEVDKMLGRLVLKLKERKKSTILVVYGDHLPSLGLTDSDLKKRNLYQTDYIIWNNYGLQTKNQSLYSYQLYSEMFREAGIHEGIISEYHQTADWKSDSYLKNLKLLEYDMLYGNKYLYDQKNPFEATNLTMGTDSIEITKVKKTEDGYEVNGKNFTPYCHIYYNGKEITSEWKSPQKIILQGTVDPVEEKGSKTEEEKEEQKRNSEKIKNAFVLEVQTGDGVVLKCGTPYTWDEKNENESSRDSLQK